MRATNPSEIQWLKLLLYGDPGSTKTRTAATAAQDPRTAPALLIDIGGNPISIRDYDKRPDIISIDALTDLNLIYSWLKGGQVTTAEFMQANKKVNFVETMQLHPPYKTLIIDGVTDLQRFSFGLVTGNDSTGPGDLPNETKRPHFNAVLGQMVKIARMFYDLPMHVIMTALEHSDKDATTELITYRPLLLGQSASEVAGYAYVVGRLVHRTRIADKIGFAEDAIGKTATSIALFKPSGKYVAKDQTGRLGSYMIDPSMTKIMDLAVGKL